MCSPAAAFLEKLKEEHKNALDSLQKEHDARLEQVTAQYSTIIAERDLEIEGMKVSGINSTITTLLIQLSLSHWLMYSYSPE